MGFCDVPRDLWIMVPGLTDLWNATYTSMIEPGFNKGLYSDTRRRANSFYNLKLFILIFEYLN